MGETKVLTSRELTVIEKHIEELKKLQSEYTEQINVMSVQKEDFDVLIESLQKEAHCLKSNGQQIPLAIDGS